MRQIIVAASLFVDYPCFVQLNMRKIHKTSGLQSIYKKSRQHLNHILQMIPVAVFPPNGFKTSFVWWLSITNNNFNASSSSYLVQHNIHFVSKLNFINTQYSSIQVFCYLHSADSVYIAGAGAVVINIRQRFVVHGISCTSRYAGKKCRCKVCAMMGMNPPTVSSQGIGKYT